ncbi:MAG: hypothetical protein HY937_04880 [Nitrosomonadales bacterium]|nr:hypothetical protein [Nitrosomonadales bacterium]
MQPLQDSLSKKCKVLEHRLEREGFESITQLPYEKYLRSTLWLAIREWVIERDRGICTICEGTAAEVHHHDYDESTMWGDQPDSLTALCARCHQLVEFDELDRKRNDLIEKKQTYDYLQNLYSQLKSEKFRCDIRRTSRRKNSTSRIQFVGNNEFLKFIDLPNTAYSFCTTFIFEKGYKERVKLPMPFKHTKLEQKSGLKLKNRETDKILATMWASQDAIVLQVAIDTTIPFEEKLLNYFEDRCYAQFSVQQA